MGKGLSVFEPADADIEWPDEAALAESRAPLACVALDRCLVQRGLPVSQPIALPMSERVDNP